MSPRAASRLVLGCMALATAISTGVVVLAFLNRSHPAGDVRATAILSSLVVAYATIGTLLVTRRHNAVGWIFIAVALLDGSGALGEQYSLRGVILEPGSLPFPAVGAWLQVPNSGGLGFAPFILLFLLFPSGRPPTPRWRIMLWLWWVGTLLILAGLLLRPGSLPARFEGDSSNPLGLEPLGPLLHAAVLVGAILLFALVPPAVAALVVRFRRARGAERQQLKWLVAISVAALFFLAGMTVTIALPRGPDEHNPVNDAFYIAFALTLIAGTPMAVAIAILRHRLWDVDRLINRTLVYGTLTGVLIAIYVGATIGMGAAFRGVTGQSSGLAVAISTLLVAALFGPARRRIQGFIDRRFYRRKYDATRTLDAFSARLRDQLDLDSLTGELLAVVRTTMQPAHVSLWLRPGQSMVSGSPS